jgi:GNAT superfamily N-acetyltransferase
MGSLLLTDWTELRMATSYLRRGMGGLATFSLHVRRLPPEHGFLVAAGLEDCLDFLEGWSADRSDRAFLKTVPGLRPADVRALATMRFTGDVWAVPEGSVVFESEPLLEVTAPIAAAQLVETFLVNRITFQTAVATEAARCRIAARGRPLVDAGIRRAHGVDAAMAAIRASAIAGFSATSNVAAAKRFGIPLGANEDGSWDAPALEGVYELVAYDGRPVLSMSEETGTFPGAKQIFRNLRRGYDILGLREEDIPGFARILRPVILAGRRTTAAESIETMSARLTGDLDALPETVTSIRGPEPLTVRISPNLEHLRQACVARGTGPQSSPAPPPGIRTADDPRIVACTTEVTLSGRRIRIRPIVMADQDGIVRGFEQLSPESRVRRFFIPPSRLSESMLRYLTEIDYTNHVALGAFAVDDPGEPGVAIARYVRLSDDPTCAEAAVTVIDDYQRRGIATVLLEALALIALRNGISRFCGYVQWENTEILDLARRVGATVQASSQAVARLELPLADVDEQIAETAIRSALRILACLEVTLAADGIHVAAPAPAIAALPEVASSEVAHALAPSSR